MLLANPPAERNRRYIFDYHGEVSFSYGHSNNLRQDVTDEMSIYKNSNNTAGKKSMYLEFGNSKNFKLTAGKTGMYYTYEDKEISFYDNDGSGEIWLNLQFNDTVSSAVWNRLKTILDSALHTSGSIQSSTHDTPKPPNVKIVKKAPTQNQLSRIVDPTIPIPRLTEFLADRMCRSAERFSNGLVEYAENKAKQMDQYAQGQEQRLEERRSMVREDVKVDPGFQGAALLANVATGAAASGVTTAVSGLCYGLSFLGSTFGPSIKSGAASMLSKVFERDEREIKHQIDEYCDVIGGAMAATGTILSGLEKSARIVGPSATSCYANAVALSHGDEAGQLAKNALGTAGNLASIGYDLKMIRPQAALKGTPVPKSENVQNIRRMFNVDDNFF